MSLNWINPIPIDNYELKIERVIIPPGCPERPDQPDPVISSHPDQVPVRDEKRFSMTVVIDLDETLVHLKDDNLLFIRPFAKNFLRGLKQLEKVELILWSAGQYSHVLRCLREIDPKHEIFHHIICRGSWMQIGIPFKDLSQLKRDRCLIIDDNSLAAKRNRRHAIIIPQFAPATSKCDPDTTLIYVLQIIGRIALYGSTGQKVSSTTEPPKAMTLSTEEWSIDSHIHLHPYLTFRRQQSIIGTIKCFTLDVSDSVIVETKITDFKEEKTKAVDLATSDDEAEEPGFGLDSPISLAGYDYDIEDPLNAPSCQNFLDRLPPDRSFILQPVPLLSMPPERTRKSVSFKQGDPSF